MTVGIRRVVFSKCTCFFLNKDCTENKKENQNGSPRRAVWSSVTQLSMELHFSSKHDAHALSCPVRTKLNDQDTDPNLSTGLRAISLHSPWKRLWLSFFLSVHILIYWRSWPHGSMTASDGMTHMDRKGLDINYMWRFWFWLSNHEGNWTISVHCGQIYGHDAFGFIDLVSKHISQKGSGPYFGSPAFSRDSPSKVIRITQLLDNKDPHFIPRDLINVQFQFIIKIVQVTRHFRFWHYSLAPKN